MSFTPITVYLSIVNKVGLSRKSHGKIFTSRKCVATLARTFYRKAITPSGAMRRYRGNFP